MLRNVLLSSCVAGVLFCGVASDAFGHGGTYRGPGDTQGPPDPGTPSTGGNDPPTPPSTGGGNPPITGGGQGTGGGHGPSTGNGPNGGGKGPSTGGTSKRVARAEGFETWQFWWEYNKDRFVNVRERLAAGANVVSGTSDFLRGEGRRSAASDSTRPSRADVETKILPVLKSVLGDNDADIVDSAVLSLGRIVEAGNATVCIEELRGALGSPYNSVKESTLLALGVLGSRDAVPLLHGVLEDSPEARKTLKVNGQIQDRQRAFAALALGYIGAPESIPILDRMIRKLSTSERDIRASAIVALGLFHESKDAIIPLLTDLLDEKDLDQDVAGQIPIALARLGADSSVPRLMKLAGSRKTERRVEESSIIALGMLALQSDEAVIDLLIEKVKDGQNDQARHFALIALGDIAERAIVAGVADDDAGVARITKTLLKELAKGAQPAHESWAAFGLAIVGRRFGIESSARREIAIHLAEKFDEEKNPSFRPAFALALGLLDVQAAAPVIREAMERASEYTFKGYCAVALGLLRDTQSRETLRGYVKQDRDIKFRLQVATALGLLGDVGATDELVTALRDAQTSAVIASAARAIGLIGDGRAIGPLTEIITDEKASGLSRGFGCVALGLLSEKTDLPWNAELSVHINYRTQISALREVLDIL